jgi:prepilin-type processing-associated H-X9-DG protein
MHPHPQGCNVLLADSHPVDEQALRDAGQGGPLPAGSIDPHSPNPFIHSIMTIVDPEASS